MTESRVESTEAVVLIRWACGLLLNASTPPPEAFVLAEIALLQRVAPSAARVPPDVSTAIRPHIDHASIAYPANARWQLAVAMLDYVAQAPPRPTTTRGEADERVRSRNRTAIRALTQIQNVDALRGEVSLRLGFLLMRNGDLDLAARSFQEPAVEAGDPWISYLGHLFNGQILRSLGDLSGAQNAFSRALRYFPDALSASLALAGVLVETNADERAHLTIRSALAAGAADPWRDFYYGDYHRWPTHAAALRAASR